MMVWGFKENDTWGSLLFVVFLSIKVCAREIFVNKAK